MNFSRWILADLGQEVPSRWAELLTWFARTPREDGRCRGSTEIFSEQ